MGLSESRVVATLAVSDLDGAKRFYEGQLGLVPGDPEPGGVEYPCADGTALFVYVAPDNAGQSRATLAGWSVGHLDETMADLASRGVAFEHYDQPGLKTDERGVFDGGHLRAAWVKDPDGNTLALTEVAR